MDFEISYDYDSSLDEEKDYNKPYLSKFNKTSQIIFLNVSYLNFAAMQSRIIPLMISTNKFYMENLLWETTTVWYDHSYFHLV